MNPLRRFVEPVMGTVASLHVVDDAMGAAVEPVAVELFAELRRLEALFSTFSHHSEISRINRREIHLLDAAPEVLEVLDACTWLEHATSGAFTARRQNGTLDPAGYVKGWAAQRASRVLLESGFCNWYLSVGGDVQTSGSNVGGQPWSVGVVNPRDTSRCLYSLEVSGLAVATSGTSERGMHIWNATGGRVDPVAAMTVVGPELRWADALATAAFVKGVEGLGWISKFPGYCAIAVTHEGEIVTKEADASNEENNSAVFA